jgi:hypothetical protein
MVASPEKPNAFEWIGETSMIKKLSLALVLTFIAAGLSVADQAAPLKLSTKYKMPDTVKGRFDHLGVDLGGNRLFLAAETAHEVLVFDLRTGKYLRAIPDIQIPHAIFVPEDLNRVFVTDGGAGEVKIFDGRNYRLVGAVKLKLDSDSIGYDPATHDLYVDNGGGDAHEPFSMLSIVDTTHDAKVGDIQIDGDTLEAMALEKSSPLMCVILDRVGSRRQKRSVGAAIAQALRNDSPFGDSIRRSICVRRAIALLKARSRGASKAGWTSLSIRPRVAASPHSCDSGILTQKVDPLPSSLST